MKSNIEPQVYASIHFECQNKYLIKNVSLTNIISLFYMKSYNK